MRVERLTPPLPVTAFDSQGAAYVRLARFEGSAVGLLRVAPNGIVGRHEAPSPQLVLVLSGTGVSSGDDRMEHPIQAGDLVSFDMGETHETRAGPEGLDLIVMEGARR